MLSYGDLKKGVVFELDGQPWQVLDSGFLRMQQRKAVMQTKLKNLISGKIVDRNFQASDEFPEAEIERELAIFIYENRGEYWFHEKGNPKERMSLSGETVGAAGKFLKPNTEATLLKFKDKVITFQLPVKMELKVIEAPPAVKGNTAQGGTKSVTLEGGAIVQAPLFINEGDVIRVNTETGEYVERMDKSR